MTSKAKDGKGYKSKDGKGPLEPITREKEVMLKRNVISNFFILLIGLDSIIREKKAIIGSSLDSLTTEKSGLDKDTHRAIGVLLGMVFFTAIVASNLRLSAQAARIGRKGDSVGDQVVDAVYSLPATLGSGLYRAGASGTKFVWSGASMVVGLAYYIAQCCNLKKRVDKEEGHEGRGGRKKNVLRSRKGRGNVGRKGNGLKFRDQSSNNKTKHLLAENGELSTQMSADVVRSSNASSAELSDHDSKEERGAVPRGGEVAVTMEVVAQENARLKSQLRDRAARGGQGAMVSQLHKAVASEKKKNEEVRKSTSILDAQNALLTAKNTKLSAQYSQLKKEYDLLLSANSDNRNRILSKTPLISKIESSLKEDSYPSFASWEIRGSRIYLPYYNAESGNLGVSTNTDLDIFIGVDDQSMVGFLSNGRDSNAGAVSEFLKECQALRPYFITGNFNFECSPFFDKEGSFVNLSVKLSANSEGHLTKNPNLDITIYGPKYEKSKPICGIDAVCLEYKGVSKSFELRSGVLEPKKSDQSSFPFLRPGQKTKVLARLFSMLIRVGCDLVAEVGVNNHIMSHLRVEGCLDQVAKAVKEVHPGSGLEESVLRGVEILRSSNFKQCIAPGSYADTLKLGTHHVGTLVDGPRKSSGGGAAMGSHSMVPAAAPTEAFVDTEKKAMRLGL